MEVTAEDIFFEPEELSIPANTHVTVSLPNKGSRRTTSASMS
jgi:hypothetical protein